MAARKSGTAPARQSSSTRESTDSLWWTLLDRAVDLLEDLGAVVLAGLGLVTLLGLLGWTQGGLIDPWAGALRRWFGWGSHGIPAIMFFGAVVLALRALGRRLSIPWLKVISLEIAWANLLGLLALADGLILPRAETGMGGGLAGWGIAVLVSDIFGPFGAALIFTGLLLLFGYLGLQVSLRRLFASWPGARREPAPREFALPESEPSPLLGSSGLETSSLKRARRRRIPGEFRKKFKVPDLDEERSALPEDRSEELPALTLLEEGIAGRVSSREINRSAGLLEATLADFGLPVKVIDFRVGPAVTQFAVEPGYIEQIGSDGEPRRSKVRVSQISALSKDLALALSAPRVRIQAPVPGQAYVGIEVPNRRSALVRLRSIMGSKAFQAIRSPLAIALGGDVAGGSVGGDLAAMPHLLISGTTGSGKSVCIASLAACLLMNNHPRELRLVMIDPKRVELSRFNGLPHLFGKVETDLERIVGVLRWCTLEMDRRFRLLEGARSRHVDEYNKRARRREGDMLPRIVIMIDELADLMMMAPDQTERTLVRLAQMGRATGIHLVVATQRPSTDVVTGLIKANFPARIAFAVATSVDSRVILDVPGAETLLGGGDMLYLSPEGALPVRLQGVFVSDVELERIVGHWREASDAPEEQEAAPWEELLQRRAEYAERDDILESAIDLVRREGEASASMLQRRLRIGYPRAARLMDELEELGVVGSPQAGGRTREVLIDENEDPLEGQEDKP